MAPIETGVYSITNVSRQRVIELTDGNLGTPVTLAYYADQDSFKVRSLIVVLHKLIEFDNNSGTLPRGTFAKRRTAS